MSNGMPAKRVHSMAWLGFALAVLALLLAWYGSLQAEKHLANSPLRQARGSAGLPATPGNWYERLWDRGEVSVFGGHMDQTMVAWTERSVAARYALEFVAFWLPLLLGIAAAWLGSSAMRRIERSRTTSVGNFQAVCAIMMGGFASVIAVSMIFSFFVWPHVPSLYS